MLDYRKTALFGHSELSNSPIKHAGVGNVNKNNTYTAFIYFLLC